MWIFIHQFKVSHSRGETPALNEDGRTALQWGMGKEIEIEPVNENPLNTGDRDWVMLFAELVARYVEIGDLWMVETLLEVTTLVKILMAVVKQEPETN